MWHLTCFKTYKNEVELHCEKFIKCLSCDRGGEYYDPTYLKTTGIIHEVTASLYTTTKWCGQKKEQGFNRDG